AAGPKARRLGISFGRRSSGRSGRAGRGGGAELPTSRPPVRQTSARRRLANAFAAGSAVPRTATAPPVRFTGGESVTLPLTLSGSTPWGARGSLAQGPRRRAPSNERGRRRGRR